MISTSVRVADKALPVLNVAGPMMRIMFGVRLRSLFTSRWMALLWAILVILTAIQYVGVADDGAGQENAANGQTLTAQQRDVVNSVF